MSELKKRVSSGGLHSTRCSPFPQFVFFDRKEDIVDCVEVALEDEEEREGEEIRGEGQK